MFVKLAASITNAAVAHRRLSINTQSSFGSPLLKKNLKEEQSFLEVFEILDTLGKGAHAVVSKVQNKDNGDVFACKYTRSHDEEIMLLTKLEYEMLLDLDHPNIIKVFGFSQNTDQGKSFLLMEYLPFKNLKDLIKQWRKAFKMVNCSVTIIMKALVEAINYLHNHCIVHRDVKPANIIVSPDLKTIKLLDFGVAKKFSNKESMTGVIDINNLEMLTPTGTPEYKAPEMVSGIFNQKVDIYSCGIVMLELLNGYQSKFDSEIKINQSIEAHDLITKMLEKNVKLRLNAKQVLAHDYLNPQKNENYQIEKRKRHYSLTEETFVNEKLFKKKSNYPHTEGFLISNPTNTENKLNNFIKFLDNSPSQKKVKGLLGRGRQISLIIQNSNKETLN